MSFMEGNRKVRQIIVLYSSISVLIASLLPPDLGLPGWISQHLDHPGFLLLWPFRFWAPDFPDSPAFYWSSEKDNAAELQVCAYANPATPANERAPVTDRLSWQIAVEG